jgi:hypothetical protein
MSDPYGRVGDIERKEVVTMATRKSNAIALAIANYTRVVNEMSDPFAKVESDERKDK